MSDKDGPVSGQARQEPGRTHDSDLLRESATVSGKTRKGHAPRRARGSNTAATSAASDRVAEHAEPSPEQQAAFWQKVEERLGLRFQHPELLREALTHRSYIYETRTTDGRYNERLEFLGDAILAFLSADYLFQTYPTLSEGELTDARAALVKTPTLADFARRLDLGAALRLGRGEERSGGRLREPLLAAAFEALLGAVYLDRGLAAAHNFLGPSLEAEAQRVIAAGRFKDDKSLLQELAQAHLSITPRYRVVSEEGPSHSRIFTVEVLLGNDVAGRGQGRNKQSAEQVAARLALEANGWL